VVKVDASGIGRGWKSEMEGEFSQLPDSGDVVKVVDGGNHIVMLDSEKHAWTMGNNDHGQLGDGTTTERTLPQKVMDDVLDICAGGDNTIFVTGHGVYAVGLNYYGGLGLGEDSIRVDQLTPALVPITDVKSCEAQSGGGQTFFLKNDGTAWGTGLNDKGQLGDGTKVSPSTPVQVMSGVKSVSAAGGHTLFMKEDGTLWAAGMNKYGELANGDNSQQDQPTPVQILTDSYSSVVSYSAGGTGHSEISLFLKDDGTVWGAGRNELGQLGQAPPGDMNPTPVLVFDGM